MEFIHCETLLLKNVLLIWIVHYFDQANVLRAGTYFLIPGGRSQSSSVSTSTTSSSTSSRQSPSAPPPPPNPATGPHPRPPGVGIGLIQLPGGHITVGGGPGVHHIRHMGPPQGGAGGGGMPPFLPPNMMDHIIQMATQAAMSRAPGMLLVE